MDKHLLYEVKCFKLLSFCNEKEMSRALQDSNQLKAHMTYENNPLLCLRGSTFNFLRHGDH